MSLKDLPNMTAQQVYDTVAKHLQALADALQRRPRGDEEMNWQPRCDCCGRFVTPGQPGASWVMVPCSDVSYGDERERCALCTSKHGPAEAMPGYVKHIVQGVYGAPPK